MIHARILCATLLLAGFTSLAAGPALAQADPDSVQLILSKPQSKAPLRTALGRNVYDAIKRRAGRTSIKILPLTKTEIWSVPKASVAAVRTAATQHGVAIELIGASPAPVLGAGSANIDISETQKLVFDQARASLAAVGIKMMMMPSPPMFEYALTKGGGAPGAKMTVELAEQQVVTISGRSVDMRADLYVFRGTVDGTGAPATLMWWPDGKMVGTVQHAGRIYTFRHMGGVVHAVVAMSEDRMPHEHAPMPARLRSSDPSVRDDPLMQQGDASLLRGVTAGMRPPALLRPGAEKRPQPGATSSKGRQSGVQPGDIVIDVIVAYTKKAAASYTDVRRELVDLSMEEANESFRASNLGHIKLRLVHAYQTDYVEEGAHFDHLWRFADKGDGTMDEIHGLRDKYKADVAVLLVDDPAGCGLATRVYADADEAFVVVHHDCAALTYTVAHEIGHLIGARHEPSIDKMTTPFPYGHGYVNGTKWRDIMSYRESCGGCPRLPLWSNPKITIKGEPAGTLLQDNARVIAEQAARVAAFR